MSQPFVRRFAAGCLAVAACLVLPPPPASAGTLTQVVCVDPTTGAGVTPNGQLPDGFDNPVASVAAMSTVATTARCGDGQRLYLPITQRGGDRNHGGALRYDAGPDMTFRAATLSRAWHGANDWTYMAGRQSTWTAVEGTPREELCAGGAGCFRLGDVTGSLFRSENLRTITSDGGAPNGFHLSVVCRSDAGVGCDGAASGRGLHVAGGEITLEDRTDPTVAGAATGPLATGGTVAGLIGADLPSLTDTGSGLYRAKVVVDDIERRTVVLDTNEGRCTDLRPGDQDPYQFAWRRPCRSAVAGAKVELDTVGLPEGPSQIRIVVEDATGNATTVANRPFVIDNVPPPTATAPPAFEGVLRAGNELRLVAGAWDDHGVAGDPAITRVWERCKYDGSDCVDVTSRVADAALLLTDADLNRRFRVRETARNSEGETTSESVLGAVVRRSDGTLPPDNDGVDNDQDGEVDEPGEKTGPDGISVDPTPPGDGGGSGGGGGGGSGSKGPGSSSPAPSGASVVTTVASQGGAPNGAGASPQAVLTVALTGGAASQSLAYGRTTVATGRLVDPAGQPIAGAVIDVSETQAIRGARAASGRTVTTAADGSFRLVLDGRSGSRSVSFSYSWLRQGPPVVSRSVAVTVRAGVRLAVALRGVVVRYSGRVLAGWMPKGGKLVIVQGRAKGGRWQTFASRRAGRTGAFKGTYRLKVRRPGKRLQFRVKVLTESGWNYGPVTSRAVTRKVR